MTSTHMRKAQILFCKYYIWKKQKILSPPNLPDLTYPIENLWATQKVTQNQKKFYIEE